MTHISKLHKKLIIKLKLDTCGLSSAHLSYSVQGGSKPLSPASWGERMPVSFSTDFEALNSHKPQVSNHFHSCADIRYQSPFTKVTGFACAGKISAAVRVIDCSVCLAISRHHGGLREPQKVSLNLSLKLCHPFFPPLSHRTNPLSAVFL